MKSNKKFDWNAPITWKGYFKLCAICAAIGAIIGTIEGMIIYYPEKILTPVNWVKAKFKKEDNEEDIDLL